MTRKFRKSLVMSAVVAYGICSVSVSFAEAAITCVTKNSSNQSKVAKNKLVPDFPCKAPKLDFIYFYTLVHQFKNVDNRAFYILGYYYETGHGTNENKVDAYAYYKIAAQHHYKPAFFKLDAIEKKMTPQQLAMGKNRYQAIYNDIFKKIDAIKK